MLSPCRNICRQRTHTYPAARRAHKLRPSVRDNIDSRQSAVCLLKHSIGRDGAVACKALKYGTVASYEETFDCFEDAKLGLLHQEVNRLSAIVARLQECDTTSAKLQVLDADQRLQEFLRTDRAAFFKGHLASLAPLERYVLTCLPVIGQSHVLSHAPHIAPEEASAALKSLVVQLLRVEGFYDSFGGIIGYQLKSLQLIVAAEGRDKSGESDAVDVRYHRPPGVDLGGEGGSLPGEIAAIAGLKAMPRMAEIYPVGGAGDRLGLCCEQSGEPLPAALLPYCGRSLLSSLVRDLQAREYLFWHLTGHQLTTPVAIMTSDAKGNHERISALMEENDWFGRGRDSFRLFRQPLVPVLCAEDGTWLLSAQLRPMMKPGGHGAIWKLMHDEGVFDWLGAHQRQAALVRQISNPMAGTDTTLLALAGTGWSGGKAFGFMSCERTVGAAEGMNVLQERCEWDARSGQYRYRYGVTNVEYTEFEKLGLSDQAADGGEHSVFPANTNILYVGLEAARNTISAACAAGSDAILPGLIFNLKKKVDYSDPLTGSTRSVRAGRMESTMQNLADALVDAFNKPQLPNGPALARSLSTFSMYNLRRKVTSSAKRRREPGSLKVQQTPDGSFYDLQRNAWHLLQRCGMHHLPELGDVASFLSRGPGFMFLFHPALGPLWEVVAQKIVGGALRAGSELRLEVAEARLEAVDVQGSLLVAADNVMGHRELRGDTTGGAGAERLAYSRHVGRVWLSNVRVLNAGVDWTHPDNCYWRGTVARREACRVTLRGNGELEARDVTLAGDLNFEVPDGHRLLLTPAPGGGVQQQLLPLTAGKPTWWYQYNLATGGGVALTLCTRTFAVVPSIVVGPGSGATRIRGEVPEGDGDGQRQESIV